MTDQHKKALQRIVKMCERADNLTMRQVRIYDAALEGLGFKTRERQNLVDRWRKPHLEKLKERQVRRDAKLSAPKSDSTHD